MKFPITVLSMVAIVASSPDDCSTFPSLNSSLDQCCAIPDYISPAIVTACMEECRSAAASPAHGCATGCIVREAKLIVDGHINKVVILDHLSRFDLEEWVEAFNVSIDRCDRLNETLLGVDQLSTFTQCMRCEVSRMCVGFRDGERCEKVEAYYENCLAPKRDCHAWSRLFSDAKVTKSCLFPRAHSNEVYARCKEKCNEDKDRLCLNSCVNELSGYVIDSSTFNVTALKATFEAAGHANWSKVLDKAAEKCQRQPTTVVSHSPDAHLPDEFWNHFSCIRTELKRHCMSIVGVSTYGMRRFREQCPDTAFERAVAVKIVYNRT